MELAALFDQYNDAFMARYRNILLPIQQQAMNAIQRCRTPAAGELRVRCVECDHRQSHPLSCGNRNCPKCQNHETTKWLDRQRAKLLPVEYFMATFTLPAEYRDLAWHYQSEVYAMLFACAISTLKSFGLNSKRLGGDMGMMAILHTHTRCLNYHPHVHIVVPGGCIDARRKQWRKMKGKFLFNEFALAKVFRARFLDALNAAKLPIPLDMPVKWVAHCKHVGTGEPALKYLSRYLYRGVISETNIVTNQKGQVTFRYIDGKTGLPQTRTLKGEEFMWLVLQHVLPKGFRRARDYGFLHGNAKTLLNLVQLVLQVIVASKAPRPRPPFKCPACQSAMCAVALIRPTWRSG
jgi:Putative transposase/Transposase zinc-binding domain